MVKYVFAYDVGTSSVKTTLIDSNGGLVDYEVESYPIHYPRPGWAEQDPDDYWHAITTSTKNVVERSNIDSNDIVGIVFTTQAMGIIPLDKAGNVLHPNISWVDGRAEKQAGKVMRLLGGKRIFKFIIGIEITGKDVIPKILWLKQEKPDIYNKTATILDVNGYLKFRATGERVFEWSGACSYSFNLKKKDFDRLLFRAVGIDLKKLPPLVRSIDPVGNGLTSDAAEAMGLRVGTPVFGGCDDVQSAQIGSTAIGEEEAHIYLGTSAWLSVATARAPKFKNSAVTLQSADPTKNVVVGITESAGANLEWAGKELYKSENVDTMSDEIFELMDQEISSVTPGSEHLIITPWVLGERCPVSTTTTRATFFNLGLNHTRAHIIRAINEGVAYNLRWILENFQKDFGFNINQVKVIGGGAQSRVWLQILADILHRDIETVVNPKFAGAIGAAMIAFVGSGIFSNFDEIKSIIKLVDVYHPNPDNYEIYDKLFEDYKSIFWNLKKTYRNANLSRFNISEVSS